MKIRNFLLLIFLIPLNLNAQKAKIDWGPEHETKIHQYSVKMVAQEGEYIYIFNEFSKKNKKVIKFSLEEEKFSEQDFDLEYEDDRLKNLKFVKTQNKVTGIFTNLDKKTDKFEIIALDLNNENFASPRLVYEHDFKKSTKGIMPLVYVPHSNEDIEAGFFLSRDSSKIIFINALSNQDTKKEDKIILAVFDDNMNLLWDKVQEIPYKDKKFDIQNTFLANNGNEVFLVGKYYKKKKEYDYKILKITKESLKEYDIVLDEKIFAETLTPFYNEKEQILVLGGVYSLKKDEIVHGVYCGTLDLENKTNNDFNYSKFTKEERDKDSKFKYYNTGSFELQNGYFQILTDSRHGPWSDTPNDFPHPNEEEITNYNGDFISIVMNGNGELLNKLKIKRKVTYKSTHKNQTYSFFNYTNHTYLLYLTRITKEDKEKYNLKIANFHFIIKVICFDNNGKHVREKMLLTSKNNKNIGGQIYTHTIQHDNKLSFLAAEYKNNGFDHWDNKKPIMFGTINLDDFK